MQYCGSHVVYNHISKIPLSGMTSSFRFFLASVPVTNKNHLAILEFLLNKYSLALNFGCIFHNLL